MSNNHRRSSAINILLGMVIGFGVVAGVVLLGPIELKAFWGASVVGLLIFAITLSDTRKSNREINTKIDSLIETVRHIEDKVDKFGNNSKSN